MKVAVLGANGMLGDTVLHYLNQQDCIAIPFNKRWTPENAHEVMRLLQTTEPDACINAIGVVPGKGVSLAEALWINGTLPGWISKHLPKSCTFIHASSDAVFAANSVGCRVDDPHSPDTDYGRSKRQGELGLSRENDMIIRTSIIGLETHRRRSLLSWFLAQSGEVVGYTNQMWNGITTLEWAKVCHTALERQINPAQRVIQPGILPPMSKYSLLKMIIKTFQHDVVMTPALAEKGVQRSLIPTRHCKAIEAQLIELRDWWPERGHLSSS
jgi:dTDP-4-dehydrorhamnose reductase